MLDPAAQLEALWSAPVGLALFDAELRYVRVNDALAEINGVAPEAHVGKTVLEALPEQNPEVVEQLRRVRDTGVPLEVEISGRTPREPGVLRTWRVSYFPVRHGGRIVGVGAAVVEVTERTRAEEALRRAVEELRAEDQRKDDFLAMLSHELRNPLASLRNALFVLERADVSAPQARRAREIAGRQVMHLGRLVDDLLDVTRVARGKLELRRDEVDLVALARRVAEDHRAFVLERGVELALELAPEPVVVDADDTRLAQVIGNLLHNALKFTPAGGVVTLRVAEDDGSAVVTVKDTGAGIHPGVVQLMFEPFVQGRQPLARTEGGLGLGLALVKGIVALHGGHVSATSDGPGRGSEFVVILPLAARAGAGARDGGGAGAEAAPGRRVLVVDDNADAAETLAQLVALLGHEAEVAFDGPTALERARVRPPDVVLCDLGLPGMDGYEVARALRAVVPGATLVAVSGYAQPEDLERAREAGFDEHVAKPADPARLERLLAGGGPAGAGAASVH